MATKLKAVIEFAEQNYTAYIDGIDGIIGVGDTVDEVKKSLEASIAFTIEGMEEDGFDVPDQLKGDYEIEYAFDTATFIQVYSKYINKAGLERITGVNQKQLWHYATGAKKPRPATARRISESVHKFALDLMDVEFA